MARWELLFTQNIATTGIEFKERYLDIAKGFIMTASVVSTETVPTALAPGTDGQVLSALASATTGLVWVNANAHSHAIADLPVISVAKGGLNKTTAVQGDILYASSATEYAALAKTATVNQFLSNKGTSNNPAWSSINYTDITGTVPSTMVYPAVGIAVSTGTAWGTSITATTVGQALLTLPNPSAIRFIRIDAANTVTARDAAGFKTDLALQNVENTAISTWAGSANITTIGTISTGSVPWANVTARASTLAGYGITDAVPSSRTINGYALTSNISLVASDVSAMSTSHAANAITSTTATGRNLLAIADPGAISFIRVNANNSVSALNAEAFRTAIEMYASAVPTTISSTAGVIGQFIVDTNKNYIYICVTSGAAGTARWGRIPIIRSW